MLIDELTLQHASKEELKKAQEELSMYSVLTDKENDILKIISNKLIEKENKIV